MRATQEQIIERADVKLKSLGYTTQTDQWVQVSLNPAIFVSYWQKDEAPAVLVSVRISDATLAVWTIFQFRKL